MPCHSATTKKLVTVSEDMEMGDAIKILQKEDITSVPVIDEKGVVQGILCLHDLLKNLLPVSVPLEDGGHVDLRVGAAPGVAKRLRNIKSTPVKEIMNRKFCAVHPDTPLWEGVQNLVQHGSPVLVTEAETGKLLGVITQHSVIGELERVGTEE